jgi:hypothetical protein
VEEVVVEGVVVVVVTRGHRPQAFVVKSLS